MITIPDKIKLTIPVVVEGKYDRLRLQELIDGPIIETGGFGIFSDPEKLSSLRQLAEKTGIAQADISKLEKGSANPSLRTLRRLAAGMGMQLKLEFVPAAK